MKDVMASYLDIQDGWTLFCLTGAAPCEPSWPSDHLPRRSFRVNSDLIKSSMAGFDWVSRPKKVEIWDERGATPTHRSTQVDDWVGRPDKVHHGRSNANWTERVENRLNHRRPVKFRSESDPADL